MIALLEVALHFWLLGSPEYAARMHLTGFNWRRVVDANIFTLSSCVGVNGASGVDFAR
jgi:hypothetical protein